MAIYTSRRLSLGSVRFLGCQIGSAIIRESDSCDSRLHVMVGSEPFLLHLRCQHVSKYPMKYDILSKDAFFSLDVTVLDQDVQVS